jgi:lipid-binding SYLF domain-containing protein
MHSTSRLASHGLATVPFVLGALALQSVACSSANNPPPSSPSSSEHREAVERLDTSTVLISEFREKVPNEVARDARCVVVIPALTQGGFIVGGHGGKGFAECRKKGGEWSTPAPIAASGASLGAQIGVQKVDVLMLFMTDEAKNSLLGGHFEVGADASASAGPVGTETSSDVRHGAGVVSYARSQGLFAGAALTGAKLSRDDEGTEALYGGLPELRSLLQGSMKSPGASADRFTSAVSGAFGPRAVPAANLDPRSRTWLVGGNRP